MVKGEVDSYNCKLCSSPSVHTTQDNHEDINSDNVSNRQYEQYGSNRYYYNYYNYGYYPSTSTNNEASNYHRDNTPPYQNQQQQQQEQRREYHGRGRGRGRANNTNAQDFNWRRQ
jgi:hypothetical protein